MTIANPVRRTAQLLLIAIAMLLCVCRSHAQRSGACGYIAAGNLKIYYCEQGEGPAVVLLHPGFLDMRVWDPWIDSLASRHRLIRIDLPGHGQSTGRDTTIRIADVLKQVMRQLKVPTASFVAASLGAACAIDFTLAYPGMVSKLVLCSPGLNGWEDVAKTDSLAKRVYVRPDTYLNTPDFQMITGNYVHYWLDGPYRATAPVDAATRDYLYRTTLDKLQRKQSSGPVFDKRKAARRVQQIRKPVLVLYGSMDIPFTAKVAAYLVKKIHSARARAVEGAHFFMLEKKDVFLRWVREGI